MCGPCWKRVPYKIQNEIYKQYKSAFLSKDYLTAIDAARDHVEGKTYESGLF